ncbi:hypothetical protein NP568_24445, partial [Vibrio parahaemolyticus]|nr:hypothetical protein [Vibrio parahaemolyticus]
QIAFFSHRQYKCRLPRLEFTNGVSKRTNLHTTIDYSGYLTSNEEALSLIRQQNNRTEIS